MNKEIRLSRLGRDSRLTDSVDLVTTNDSAGLAATHGSADWAIYYSWLMKISSAATKPFFT